MPAGHQPLAVLLLVVLLLAASAAPATATGGGGRMVIVRKPGRRTTIVAAAAGGGARSSSRYEYERRLVEDEVAPELAAGLLLGADYEDFVSSGALIADKAVCIHNCGGRGQPHVRPCANIYLSQGC